MQDDDGRTNRLAVVIALASTVVWAAAMPVLWFMAVLPGQARPVTVSRVPVYDRALDAAEPAAAAVRISPVVIGASGETILSGVSERALEPGRYRLRAELALSPVAGARAATRHYTIEAAGAERILNNLHFSADGGFEEFRLAFEVERRQTVPVTIRWQPRPGPVVREAEDAEALEQAPVAPGVELEFAPEPHALDDHEGGTRFMARGWRIEVLSPVQARVATDKIVYRPGERGEGRVELANRGAGAETVTLTLERIDGLDGSLTLLEETLTIPAGGHVVRTVAFDTADLYWGCEVRATIAPRDGRPRETETAIFCVASNMWEVAAIAGHGPDYGYAWKDPERAAHRVSEWRRQGFTGCELYFWAPCNFGDFTPEREHFVGGQVTYRHSIGGTRNLLAACREQGLSASLYSNLWAADGYSGYELMRRFPGWFDTQGSWFDVASMELWRAMEDGKLPPSRSWFRVGVSTDWEASRPAIEWHAREIVASQRQFGWDAVRYDTYLSSEWTKRATRLTREIVEREIPGFQFGYNSFTLADEAIGALEGMLDGGGMAMVEYIRFEQFASPAAILDALLAVRAAAWRHGGHVGPLYRPPEPGTSAAADAIWLSSIILAAGGHPYYAPLENEVGNHPAFALRYSEFLWNNRMRPLDDPDATVAFDAELNPLRWRELARILDRGPRGQRLVVHILNTDDRYRHFRNLKAEGPALLREVPVSIRLPDRARVEGAWHLTAVPEARHETVPFARDGGRLRVTIPRVRFWSVLVVDYHVREQP